METSWAGMSSSQWGAYVWVLGGDLSAGFVLVCKKGRLYYHPLPLLHADAVIGAGESSLSPNPQGYTEQEGHPRKTSGKVTMKQAHQNPPRHQGRVL